MIPQETWNPKRAVEEEAHSRAGTKSQTKKRRYKPYLPSTTMGNVRSLAIKMDELAALTRSQRDYRESSVLCFTESWPHKNIPDSDMSVDGFQTVRLNRNCRESGKRRVWWLTDVIHMVIARRITQMASLRYLGTSLMSLWLRLCPLQTVCGLSNQGKQDTGTSRNKKGQSWLFAPVIQCLQYHVEDALPVCGSQCRFLCCRVLGQQGEGSQCQQNQQAHQEGWLCPGYGAWYFGSGVREEDATQTVELHGKRLLSSAWCAGHAQEHLQQQTVTTTMHHRTGNPFFLWPSNLTTHLRQAERWTPEVLHFSSVLFSSALLTLNHLFLWITVSLSITTII